jgi:hypothetical protein
MAADHKDSTDGGFWEYLSASCVVRFLQVEKDYNMVLVHEKVILDRVLQICEVVKRGSVLSKPTLGIQK